MGGTEIKFKETDLELPCKGLGNSDNSLMLCVSKE